MEVADSAPRISTPSSGDVPATSAPPSQNPLSISPASKPAASVLETSTEVKVVVKQPRKTSRKPRAEKVGPKILSTERPAASVSSPSTSFASAVPFPRSKSAQISSGVKHHLGSAFLPKLKETKSLTYVNYLNAFANSLTAHPPGRRPLAKSNTGLKSPGEEDGKNVSVGGIPRLVDFESGGRLGHTVAYIPDFDRDRCFHAESFCPFSKREGYVFCEKHLLDDKALPFVPCAYQRTESNPCPYPARMPPGAGGKNRPQRSKEALCALHMEKCVQEVQSHMGSSANSILSTMDGLALYNANSDKGLPPTSVTEMLDDLAEQQTRDNLETYLRATAKDTYATDISSDESAVEENDLALFTSKAFDTDDELDSEDDEPLKYCHSYSVEELARLLRWKLGRQRELLTLEVRLQEYKLKDARARYLTEVNEETSFLPSVSSQARTDPESQKAYRELRTMMRFNRRHPTFPFHHARKPCVKMRHLGKMPESVTRCLHAEPLPNGKTSKCKMYSLPFSRHCLAHILEDNYQYLYKKCAWDHPDQCPNPVLKSMGVRFCYLHTDLNKPRLGVNLDDTQSVESSSEAEPEPVKSVSPVTEDKPKKSRRRARDSQSAKAAAKTPAEDENLRVDDSFEKLEQQENVLQPVNDSGSRLDGPASSGPHSSSLVSVSMSDL